MPAPYRILLTGSRDWADRAALRTALDKALCAHRWNLIVVHGGCGKGADALAAEWCRETADQGVREETHPVWPADWRRFGNGAGPMRNQGMVDAGADECFAFIVSGSRGASHCAARAEAAGIPVRKWTV